MQDRYVGDVGDFGKYGLLRALCCADEHGVALRLGVHWHRVDGGPPSSRGDGSHTQYLDRPSRQERLLRECDRDLLARMRQLVRGTRTIDAVETSGALPAGTLYFGRAPDFARAPRAERPSQRSRWRDAGLRALEDADIVFQDPDNGLEVPSSRPLTRPGTKHAYYDDLRAYWQRGQSLVVYHHVGRTWRGQQATAEEQVAHRVTELRRELPGAEPLALRFRRRSARVYFVVPAPAHDGRLRARTSAFLSSAWGRGHPPHFEGMKWPSRHADAPGGAPRPGRPARDDGGGAPKPTIHVSLLAGFGVTVDGVARKVPEAASRLAAVLALRPGRFSRFLVAKTLRPDLGRPDAARHLRGALSRLRASTSPAIVESGRETVRLASHVTVDSREVDDLLARRREDIDGFLRAAEPERLTRELLPGWDEQWVLLERHRTVPGISDGQPRGVLRRPWRARWLTALGAAALVAGLLSFPGGTADAQNVGPTISSVSVSSSPANALFYLTGETIRFSVNFTSVVEVGGSPTLAVEVGGTEREAAFESARGSEMLFAYTVTDDDFDGDGVSVAADSLSLGSDDTITDSGSRAASLTHVAFSGGSGHRVNMSVVTIAADSDEPVPENETAGFTVSRTGSLARELTVFLRAERRQYFVYTSRVPRTVKLEAGQATVQFEVPLVNDSDLETEDGSLTVIVAEGLGYLVGSPGSAVAVLTDDDDILLEIVTVTGGTIVEGFSSIISSRAASRPRRVPPASVRASRGTPPASGWRATWRPPAPSSPS